MKTVQRLKDVTNSIVFKTDNIAEMKEEIAVLLKKIETEEEEIKKLTSALKNIAIGIDKEVSNG